MLCVRTALALLFILALVFGANQAMVVLLE